MRRAFASLTIAAGLASGCRMSEDGSAGIAAGAAAEPAPAAVHAPPPALSAAAAAVPSSLATTERTPQAAGWNAGEVEWLSFDVATQRARADQSPICLVVYTSWCPHCRNFSHVFEDPRVVERAKRFRMVRVDADQEPAIAGRFVPDGAYIPRTFFLSSDGTLDDAIHLERAKYQYFYDERNPAALVAAMDSALQKRAR